MTKPTSTRADGDRYEKLTMKWHQRRDIPCRLTHASGQLRRKWDDWRADLDVGKDGTRWLWKVEVKSRSDSQGWKRLDAWLGGNDVLVLGTGFVLLSEHGYDRLWGGVPSPMVAKTDGSTAIVEGFLSNADLAILWHGETFSAFCAWETFVKMISGRN